MLVPFCDKAIQVKDMGCAIGSFDARPIAPAVNLFVKVTDTCNARCCFCSNVKNVNAKGSFNVEKLWRIIRELQKNKIIVNRVNITGGEPSNAPVLVEKILSCAENDEFSGIHLHLNTNGVLPASKDLMRHPCWDSISISLHHYNMRKLAEIYGISFAYNLFDFSGIDLDKVNASCNLIKGYIDNTCEVEKMLQFVIRLGLPRLGFVSLMKVNDYCVKHFVDFSDISFEVIPHLYFTESRNRGGDCKCSNYLYNHGGKMLEVYMRNYVNFRYCESSLLYDGVYLRQGFHDSNIIC